MADLTLKDLQKLIMDQAKDKGFGTDASEINIPEKIALIHSEISSGYEGHRKKIDDGCGSLKFELAGAMQRIIHLMGCLNIDAETAIKEKLEENKDRVWDWDKLNEGHS
jgi:hypothetical protein